MHHPRARFHPQPSPAPKRRDPPPVPPGLAALESLKAANGEGIDDMELGGNVGEWVSGGEPVTGALQRPVIPKPDWSEEDTE